jgi:hypothetical protein
VVAGAVVRGAEVVFATELEDAACVERESVDGPGVDGPGVDGPGVDGPGVEDRLVGALTPTVVAGRLRSSARGPGPEMPNTTNTTIATPTTPSPTRTLTAPLLGPARCGDDAGSVTPGR